MLAQYKPDKMLKDRRCTYTNASFPWIETIHKYEHHDVVNAFATATLSIQARKGPGRYQGHYKWSSYCDVIDVDVRAAGPVLAPYGTPINSSAIVYDTAHHCWFEKPRRMGQCYEVVTDTAQCAAMCNSDPTCRAYQMLPLQLDTSAGNSYGLFPDKSFVPWGKNIAFCDKSQFTNASKQGGMVCFPIYSFQDDFNSARPLWSFTDDPDHQGFYGTCYIKPPSRSFLNFTKLPDDDLTQFRFQSKCIPCDNIGQSLTTPRWGPQQNYCTDCAQQAPNPRPVPVVPTWTFYANGTFQQEVIWLSPGGSPFAFKDECIMLAVRDPQCSKYVMYSDLRAQRLSGRIQGLPPTDSRQNVNSSYRFINTTNSSHYSPFTLYFPYYRSCACLKKPNGASAPSFDATGVARACDFVKPTECLQKGFLIYQLP
jgi:hypothetical protein